MSENAFCGPCACCSRPTQTHCCAYCNLLVQAEIERPGILRRAEAEAHKKVRNS